MEFSFFKEWSGLIALFFSAVSTWIVYRNWQEKKPVIDITVEDLEASIISKNKVTVIVKNVGNKGTSRNPEITVSCSWMPSVSYKLNLPSSNYNIEPNEQITWKLKLDDKPPANSKIVFKVKDAKFSWEHHEQIS